MVLTPVGTDIRKKRGQRRWLPGGRTLLILGLVVVLVAAGVGGYFVFGAGDEETTHAEQSAKAYLTAWSRADYPGMAAHADMPAPALQTADQAVRTGLQEKSTSYQPGQLKRDGDHATESFTAVVQLAGLGEWRYNGSLPLVRGKDAVWRVQFGPSAIYPQLQPGQQLTRASVTAARGQLLDASGQPLRGKDSELDSNVLGSVGPLNADQAAAAGPRYAVGDVAGQSGLERAYNDQLAGTPGGAVQISQGGHVVTTLQSWPATPGHDVQTTLDLTVQKAAESGMSGVGNPGAMVAIDVRTGAVLAVVDHPLAGYARALRGSYPPGSTFKVITATAALMAGKTESTPYACPPVTYVAGRPFKNAENESYGTLSLEQAFALSCNTAFVNIRRSIDESDMRRAADLYGFDGSQPLPIQSTGGNYPKPSGPVDMAASAFGQAAVTASPLQMASVAAGVAAGEWRRPFLVGTAQVTHPIPPDVDASLKDMMRAVVTSGTAAPVAFPGTVYGKTGTAEYGTGPNLPTHAWFIGWRGNVAFGVIVENGGFGAETAAPAASRFLSALGTYGE